MNNTINKLKQGEVFFLEKLPSIKKLSSFYKIPLCSSFIICDKKKRPQIQKWLKKKFKTNNLPIYFVQGGEKLKNFSSFEEHSKNILKKISSQKIYPSCFIGIGGGSVSDFTGFFSSIYKRGKPVYYFPTTLLSALDASHGGKTAMNFLNYKNFFGTYHFPQSVCIIKELIGKDWRKKDYYSASGELLKMALIVNKKIYNQLQKKKQVNFQTIWSQIPQCVKSKLFIINKDPFEKNQIRKILNFGHTLGHCIEAYHQIEHGVAVAYGMRFAVLWSVEKGMMNSKKGFEILNLLKYYAGVSRSYKIPIHLLKKLLQEDKKVLSSDKIDFVFLKEVGNPLIQTVNIKDVIQFYQKTQTFSY